MAEVKVEIILTKEEMSKGGSVIVGGDIGELAEFLTATRVIGCDVVECRFNGAGECWAKKIYIQDGGVCLSMDIPEEGSIEENDKQYRVDEVEV